jgi:hypothetical protein
MKRTTSLMAGLTAIGLLLSVEGVQAQHGHINAGAKGTNQGDQLYWANGDIFAYNSGYVKELTYAATGTYAGNYDGNISFTALPATTANSGPAFAAPALGSFLVIEVVSVEGPAGGSWSYWDTGATNPTLTVTSGTTDGTSYIDLSDKSKGAGTPGADPYGHLHGRRFSVSKWGVYKVGFKILDVSTNGTGGGPIHADSDVFFINWGTKLRLTQLSKNNDGVSLKVSGDPDVSFFLETRPTLAETDPWTTVAGPLNYPNRGYYPVTDPKATGPARFYRLLVAP